jgi:hypothetical protein
LKYRLFNILEFAFNIAILVVVFNCVNCNRRVEIERDQISFDVPISDIRDSIIVMNRIMDKLNFAEDQPRIISWFIMHNEKYIDINSHIFKIDSIKPEDLVVLDELSIHERKRFLELIFYMISNELSSCRKDIFPHNMSMAYFYDYRNYLNSAEPHYLRNIVILDSINDINGQSFENYYKVLDKNAGLILLKFDFDMTLLDSTDIGLIKIVKKIVYHKIKKTD